ncbi:hypothetical protein Golax_009400 [Gossypium laxum]|uniref:Uncharacterized protein n=1 Tax=Gossypium laxum TaxID=34288 RepID=A0A7J9ACX4_9ROSI|nr:hypothetical protein [Gossypium laxum]
MHHMFMRMMILESMRGLFWELLKGPMRGTVRGMVRVLVKGLLRLMVRGRMLTGKMLMKLIWERMACELENDVWEDVEVQKKGMVKVHKR